MADTPHNLSLRFRGKADSYRSVDQAIDALREVLDSLPEQAFLVEEQEYSVVVRATCPGPNALHRDAALQQAREFIEKVGDSILYLTGHASENYPELHRDEVILLRRLPQENEKGVPTIELTVDFEYMR